MMKKDLLKGLSKEQLEKARGCKTSEELLKLAQEENVELTEEQLLAVSGGCGSTYTECPYCHSKNITVEKADISSYATYHCNDCDQTW